MIFQLSVRDGNVEIELLYRLSKFGLDRIVSCYESSAREIQLLVISIQPPASISRIDLF